MKPIFSLLLFALLIFSNCQAQDKTATKTDDKELPYVEIPEAPKNYSAETVTARTIDGLGYRYHWATKDLRKEDLEHKISETNRTTLETITHIYNLSNTILNAVKNEPNVPRGDRNDGNLDFEALRKKTLENLKAASDLLLKEDAKVEDMKIIFKRGERTSEFPFWNLLNGPIADAIWHTGQVVSLRRASGNPLPPGVNVFIGKTKK